LELGLDEKQVKAGLAKTEPFEHRMQPRTLNGATIIDDTYNGNLQGVRVGTALLKELPARRKWYVTPGLVDQGSEANAIHRQMGELIADASPDIVVLMANSAQPHILEGLRLAGYGGEVRIEHNPLQFYTNLPHFIAAGDLVLMQNDWTDNYA
jgi:UDP-N-acetylmuramyl pentapeptide synthase